MISNALCYLLHNYIHNCNFHKLHCQQSEALADCLVKWIWFKLSKIKMNDLIANRVILLFALQMWRWGNHIWKWKYFPWRSFQLSLTFWIKTWKSCFSKWGTHRIYSVLWFVLIYGFKSMCFIWECALLILQNQMSVNGLRFTEMPFVFLPIISILSYAY